MPRTRVKICGITREQDVHYVADNGADAIGLNFYEGSPRFVSAEKAAKLSAIVPAFVVTAALFKDAEAEYVERVLSTVSIDLLQFHGSESAEFCRSFGKPYIKALGMKGEQDIQGRVDEYDDARGVLLDAHEPGADGGTGECFDWNAIPPGLSDKLILAGGLHPDNVFDAIRATRPYAVDLSSGVEADKGIKSAELVQRLMLEVRRADSE